MQWKRPSWMTDEGIELLLNSKKDFNAVYNVGSPPHYEIDVTPYDLTPRQLIKSILDKYDLSYIDTDMAATKEAYKNYILEGKKMPIKTRPDSYDPFEGYSFSFKAIDKADKYAVKKIIHSGLWTIVTWEDGTLTKVKMEDDGHYDEYAAFTAALAKKVYGNNSKVHKILETKTIEQKQKAKKKEDRKC